ncbi:MAG TPA: hypothetical protein P5328_02300 [Candidatus Paceibacterota bacterium]|nr:hypothetical protein [Candidatus Paceibacterota bacterium]HRZ34416.1 hypothetical protein [Candidatus Paceibacterota bacterium]
MMTNFKFFSVFAILSLSLLLINAEKVLIVGKVLAAEKVEAAESAVKTNAGFVSGIWYSKFPLFADENARIYVAFQNQSGDDITGQIEFYDNGKRIETKEFSALNGRLIEGWADFAPEYGTHQIYAKLTNVKKNTSSGWRSDVEIKNNIIESEEIFVDYDSDDDGIGDEEDDEDNRDTKEDDENDIGGQVVSTIKETADSALQSINTGADSLSDKIEGKILALEEELADLKARNEAIKQTIVEGRAELSAPAEGRMLSRQIFLKTGQLYLFKTLYGILEYKILLYLVIAFLIWILFKIVRSFVRR